MRKTERITHMNWFITYKIRTPEFMEKMAQAAQPNYQNNDLDLQSQLPSGYYLKQKPNGMWVVTTDISGEEIELVHDEPTPEQALRLAKMRIAILAELEKENIKFSSHEDLITYLSKYSFHQPHTDEAPS